MLDAQSLDTLFRNARSQNGWLADPVTGAITPDPSDLTQLSSINVGSVGGTAEKTTRVGVNVHF